MRSRLLATFAFAVLAGACGGDPDLAAAADTLAQFQAALLRGDEAACRTLLTRESAAAVAELPWQQLRTRQPLVVLGTERGAGEFLVQVADPNEGGRRSEFVVVREHGRFCVDLVATAGRHGEVVEASGTTEQFEPRELTPADHDRIRQYELAQPPR
ncbi:MAG: hypothetical protein JNL08_08420 [Planctomycetes bacterium]|nr:hypothetical protein [Planctomycetota bacterium]